MPPTNPNPGTPNAVMQGDDVYFFDAEGCYVRRHGGSLAWRTNNPFLLPAIYPDAAASEADARALLFRDPERGLNDNLILFDRDNGSAGPTREAIGAAFHNYFAAQNPPRDFPGEFEGKSWDVYPGPEVGPDAISHADLTPQQLQDLLNIIKGLSDQSVGTQDPQVCPESDSEGDEQGSF
jgi:hypothetical protein